MENKPTSAWEARNEAEMLNALDVMYEMAIGFVLAELREEHPDHYAKLASQSRRRSQLVNNVRYSVDAMLSEIINEYSEEAKEE